MRWEIARGVATLLLEDHDKFSDNSPSRPEPEWGSTPTWFPLWKREGSRDFRMYLNRFGTQPTPEALMTQIEKTLWADREFHQQVSGGIFMPIPAHMCLPVKFVL